MEPIILNLRTKYDRGEITAREFVYDLIVLVEKNKEEDVVVWLNDDIHGLLRATVNQIRTMEDIPQDFATKAKAEHTMKLKQWCLRGCAIWRDYYSKESLSGCEDA